MFSVYQCPTRNTLFLTIVEKVCASHGCHCAESNVQMYKYGVWMVRHKHKEETLQSENDQCVKMDTPTRDQKAWKCREKADSEKDPRWHVRSNFLDCCSQESTKHEISDVK